MQKMPTLNLPTRALEIAVVSDVHIGSPSDHKFDLLCSFCEQVHCKTIVLNGDIFEFFIGDRVYFYQRYKKLFDVLENRGKTGTRVIFNQGNHEFFLHELKKFCPTIECVVSDFKIGETFFTHGDDVQGDRSYELYKKVSRSLAVRWIARLLLPSRFLDYLCQHIAKLSRKKDQYRQFDESKILDNIKKYGHNHHENKIVVGHFHFPFKEKGAIEVFSVRDWPNEPNFLGLSANGWEYFKLL